MELALSLGDPPKPFSFIGETQKLSSNDLGFCMGLLRQGDAVYGGDEKRVSSDPPLQLDLLPFSPVPRPQLCPERGWLAAAEEPNSAVSSFQMAFGMSRRGKREVELEMIETDQRVNTRGSDDDENGSTHKKLRLSQKQSAFLEESFKEHNTLNTKQKLALAKQLNLRPRQIEVWFQNRRARTKLKQTEVDCEYLKRCCETLAEENKRLQKELQELRALKSCQPFYTQLPATTLTMCPSCERVTTATASGSSNTTDVKTGEYPFLSPTNA
ncbi:Homeobox-leucine zipper protein HAT14 [Hibiscus syriacus]|uniref:Homeobox-leucine zipper protein HAT14 n=1 Tax=Hibiscus syriacus TaxID=106335 RepID=A0A6A3CE20_HIBSY|nr:homeobox-leucine zipper protein HAT14-like [Hibiscus syriacus]KAE8726947.1 Homeobox-leucine zipper protein HAT14 [Hibiscus syriacus]